MSMKRALEKILAVLSIIIFILAAYFLLARPYQMRWGATDEEVLRQMPGDEFNTDPTFLATRAITVDTVPEAIWPWLVQMGFHRAGFYGYDIIEGIGSRTGMTSAERIVPEFQHPAVGDTVPISVAAWMRFQAIEPYRSIIWAETVNEVPKGGFTWALYPIDSGRTRLVSRIRWSHHWEQPWILTLELFTEFTDHLAIRKILYGIKGRAEGAEIESLTGQTIEFFYYFAAGLIFLIGLLLLLLRPLTGKQYVVSLAAGAMWLIVWYSALPIWAGILLQTATGFSFYSTRRHK